MEIEAAVHGMFARLEVAAYVGLAILVVSVVVIWLRERAHAEQWR